MLPIKKNINQKAKEELCEKAMLANKSSEVALVEMRHDFSSTSCGLSEGPVVYHVSYRNAFYFPWFIPELCTQKNIYMLRLVRSIHLV
jgi:hypothetical protein